MRAWVGLSLLAGALLSSSPAEAQDAETLRKELEQVRKQFESMKEGYEKAINQLSDRIQKLESQPRTPVAPVAVPTAPAQVLTQAPAPGQPSLMQLARPREPFSLYERRGPGQLLLDIGVASDFIGNLVQQNVAKAQAGTFPGQENRFFPREVEISLFGQIDPYAYGEVRFEAGEESGSPNDVTVSLAEANLTLLTLPFNTQSKLGRMRLRWGLLNPLHEHDRPFIDQPDVLTQFIGQEGLRENGNELTWVAPLPFYLQALFGLFNGDNETAFGYSQINKPLITGRLRTFFELGDFGAIQIGASVANGLQSGNLPNTLWGLDAKYKYTPEGWLHPLVTLLSEAIFQHRQVIVAGVDLDGDGVPDTSDEKRWRNRWGFYVGGEVQPFRSGWLSRWAPGLRYDQTQYPINPGWQWAVEPYLSFMPSEFLRFRLGYKHTERSSQAAPFFAANGGSARIMDEWFFQATFILGAHPAHPF